MKDELKPNVGAGPVERWVGRPVEQRANAPSAPCPNPPLGRKCPLCGGELYCMDAWRRKA
jgi:hypothetical protein